MRCPELTFLLCFRAACPFLLAGRMQAGWNSRLHPQDQHLGRVGEGAGKERKAISLVLPLPYIKKQHFRSGSNSKRDGGRRCGCWTRPCRICRPSPPTTTRRKWQRSTFTERIRRRALVNGIDSGLPWYDRRHPHHTFLV